jgi:mRNA interferase RelE/StbE
MPMIWHPSAIDEASQRCRSSKSSRICASVASYSIDVRKSAAKELAALPKRDCQSVVEKIRVLGSNPRPNGSEKLSGDSKYRIRHGDYRVLYEIDDADQRVTIVKVAHRREVYR